MYFKERSPRSAVTPDEIPKEANVSEWLRKKHTEQKQEIKELEINTDLLHKKVAELKVSSLLLFMMCWFVHSHKKIQSLHKLSS